MTVEDALELLGELIDPIQRAAHARPIAATQPVSPGVYIFSAPPRGRPPPQEPVEEGDWTTRFIRSVREYVRRQKPLSTNQGKTILKLFERHAPALRDAGLVTIPVVHALVANPIYRQPPYQSQNIPREVRYLGGNLVGFRFKRDPIIVDKLKRLGAEKQFLHHSEIWFHRVHRLWVVPVTRETLVGVQRTIKDHGFAFDDALLEYLTSVHNNLDASSAFVMDKEMGVIAAQVCDNELIAWWIKSVADGEVV